MPRKGPITVVLEENNDVSIQGLQKYSNKAKRILNGNASVASKRSSNLKITNNSIIAKKATSSN